MDNSYNEFLKKVETIKSDYDKSLEEHQKEKDFYEIIVKYLQTKDINDLMILLGNDYDQFLGDLKSQLNIVKYFILNDKMFLSQFKDLINEINKNIPIYIAAYKLDDTNATDKGGYVYEGYYKGGQGNFTSLKQEWVLVPSSRFTELDSTAANEFTTFKEEISNVLPDNTFVTGEAKFESKKLRKLNLTITAHGKTAGEVLAIIEHAKDQMSTFETKKCDYLITILNDDTVYALIERKSGSSECNVISKI